MIQLTIGEILLIKSSLNSLHSTIVENRCPNKVKNNLNKYHKWLAIETKNKTSDFWYIEKLRNKLYTEECKLLTHNNQPAQM
jgi:hypothetical protein